jgi:hypothetical protein
MIAKPDYKNSNGTVRGEPPRGSPRGATTVRETGYSSTVLFWIFREINGDQVTTILVFKSADN